MANKAFDPRSVPLYPQTTIGAKQIDFDNEDIAVNPYIMRARMASQTGLKGQWNSIQLPQYSVDTYASSGAPWSTSLLYNQTSSLDKGTTTKIFVGGVEYEFYSSVSINLTELSNQKYATSGVKVWFRWIDISTFFDTAPSNPMPETRQAAGVDPGEWTLLGVYNASSFSTAIPRHQNVATDRYFQILVTDNTTIKPNKYNYRWVSAVSDATYNSLTKIGEPWGSGATRGYLPWNPTYATARFGSSSTWTIYMRQRTTLQDIAIFYPRRWRI